MSRTERNHLRYDWDTDQVRLNPNGRDDKGRCYCCGNDEQKRNNKRDRASARRMNLLTEYPNLPQISNEYE